MNDDVKQRVIDYYNQEAADYISQYRTPRLDQEFYPANDIRLDIVVARLKANGCRTVLDIGCGSAGPLLRMLAEGLDARGVDFAPAMIDCARQALADAGHDPQRVTAGDVEDASTLPKGRFDAVVATGVFPHNLDDVKAYAAVRAALTDGGVALIEYRNELMSLFSLNTYSYKFFTRRLLDLATLPTDLAVAAEAFLADRFAVPPVERERGKPVQYDQILARFHNPLTLATEVAGHGFALNRMHFYHFHCAPPHFEASHTREFRSASVAMEQASDWRGHFLASAFVAELQPRGE
jgi:SAM-dependent methyltransferase